MRKDYFLQVLAIGDRSEIGLLDVPFDKSFLGLGIGMIFARFQMSGMMLRISARLNTSVRY